jgi:hypothetical protein
MVVTPLVRGLMGIEATEGGRTLTFAPQLPADWDRVSATNVPAGEARYDLALQRSAGSVKVTAIRRAAGRARLIIAPAFPLDARVVSATIGGRAAALEVTRVGDIQRAQVTVPEPGAVTEIVFAFEGGTEVYASAVTPGPGDRNEGLRVVRARPEPGVLRLVVEGRGGSTYPLGVRTARTLGAAPGVTLAGSGPAGTVLAIVFEGPDGAYVRREIAIPLN